ncbi:ribonuclease H-like domain-containing protein [Trametes punicea]|nr:ribonuclease H-like domain-containing protein [Trametes punicea]
MRTNPRLSSTSLLKRAHSESESELEYTAYLGVGSDALAFPPRLKDEFQTDFCKLLLSGNCAFRLAEAPYWRYFFTKWIPGSELPSRQAASGRILDAEADRVLDGMKMHLQGRYGTGQSDGWKSISKASIIASMVNVEYDPYILHSHDVTEQPKTAENLLKIVDAEIDFCEKILNIILAAWCTDGGGDCVKMCRLLQAKWPDLATPHCWLHQIRLTVGDYLKEKLPVVDVLDVALEVIKWFNNHTGALALLRQEQQRQYGRVLSLFRPVPTRWTSHYLSGDRLIETEDAMRVCIVTSKAKLITCAGKEQSQVEKAKSLLDKLEEPSFWSLLREARTHLEPLAIACNATQGDNARLDVVLVTLGNLYHIYCNHSQFDNTQDLYILAIILNLFLRLTPLRKNNPLFTRQSLWQMFKCNYVRMIGTPTATAVTALYAAFVDYLSGIGGWSDEAMGLEEIALMAEHLVSTAGGSPGCLAHYHHHTG